MDHGLGGLHYYVGKRKRGGGVFVIDADVESIRWCYGVIACRLGNINVLRRIGRLGQIPGVLW